MRQQTYPHVDTVKGKNGLPYYYYRPPGEARMGSLPRPYGGAAFIAKWSEYHSEFSKRCDNENKPSSQRPNDGRTFTALIELYSDRHEFTRRLKLSTQRAYCVDLRQIRTWFDGMPIEGVTEEDLRDFLDQFANSPAKFNRVRQVLSSVMKLALQKKWTNENAVTFIGRLKPGTYHTWTETEITAFRTHWPVGTTERLAFELFLYTGQRISDVVNMEWRDLQNEHIHVVPVKTNGLPNPTELWIRVHRFLSWLLDQTPRNSDSILVKKDGAPHTLKTLDHMMRNAYLTAGLQSEERKAATRQCVTHGLRKAMCRRLAEVGCSAMEIQAITGHASIKELEVYVKEARKVILAQGAIAKFEGAAIFDADVWRLME